MSNEAGRTSAIRDYLLARLPEAEAERIESWYFTGGQAVDEVWAVFSEMCEEYLSGALSESDARRFEQRLQSSPALRQMFENEKALHDRAARIVAGVSRQIESKNSGWRQWLLSATFFKPSRLMAALAVTLIVLSALITWFALRPRESANPESSRQADARDQKATDNVARASVDPQRPPQSVSGENDKSVGGKIPTEARPGQRKSASGIRRPFLLLATGTRGGESKQTLVIPAQLETVQIELELPTDDCAVYSAVLQTESGEEIQRWKGLRARRADSTLRVAPLRVSGDSLKDDGYVISLECVSRLKDSASGWRYLFKAERR
jgi:hypothetical protein